jgi:hypothetical protein
MREHDWVMFRVDQIQKIEETGDTFPQMGAGYKSSGRSMATIYAEL